MDQSFVRSERFTAVASTVVAVLILAAGVSARNAPSPGVTPRDVSELESDLRFQINTAFRRDAFEQQRRLQQLDEVVAAWEVSPKADADRRLMATWLRNATIRSVPGKIAPFPPIPEFGVEEAQAVETPEQIAEQVFEDPATEVEERAAEQTIVVAQRIRQTPAPLEDDVVTNERPASKIKPVTQIVESSTINAEDGEVADEASAEAEAELPVVVNLIELSARITGYHHTLDRVERALSNAEQPSLSTLTDQVNTVNDLVRDYQFVSLYFESLAEGEQRVMVRPRSLRSTIKSLERHLDRFQSRNSDDFLEPFDSAVIEQLDVLRGMLAEISDRIGE